MWFDVDEVISMTAMMDLRRRMISVGVAQIGFFNRYI